MVQVFSDALAEALSDKTSADLDLLKYCTAVHDGEIAHTPQDLLQALKLCDKALWKVIVLVAELAAKPATQGD